MNPQASVPTAPTPAPTAALTGSLPQATGVTGQQTVHLPDPSTIGNNAQTQSVNAAFQGLNQDQLKAITSGAQTNMGIAQANASVNQQNYSLQASRLQSLATISNQMQQDNPANWVKKSSPDGGYNFFDGLGNPIGLGQYLNGTGQSPAAVLKGSTNPADQNLVDDYTVVEKIGQYLLAGDQKGLQTYDNSNFGGQLQPALQKLGITNNPGGYNQLVSGMMNYYSSVYGQNATTPPSASYLFGNNQQGNASTANAANQINSNPVNQLLGSLGL